MLTAALIVIASGVISVLLGMGVGRAAQLARNGRFGPIPEEDAEQAEWLSTWGRDHPGGSERVQR